MKIIIDGSDISKEEYTDDVRELIILLDEMFEETVTKITIETNQE